MSRLTRRKEKYNMMVGDRYEPIATTREINNKLGELEDLEEELGCPLEVVFKALKQDYIYTKSGKHPHIELGTYGIMWCICCGLRVQLNIADYKKSWWLKEDKSE